MMTENVKEVPAAVPPSDQRIKLAEVSYDKPDMLESNTVQITFNLENLSRLPYGVDIILGRMDRIREDLAFIIMEKQARRAKLANPAGPIKIVQ